MNLATRADLEAAGQLKHMDEMLGQALTALSDQVDVNGRLLRRIEELSQPCRCRNRRAFVLATWVALFWFVVAAGLGIWVIVR